MLVTKIHKYAVDALNSTSAIACLDNQPFTPSVELIDSTPPVESPGSTRYGVIFKVCLAPKHSFRISATSVEKSVIDVTGNRTREYLYEDAAIDTKRLHILTEHGTLTLGAACLIPEQEAEICRAAIDRYLRDNNMYRHTAVAEFPFEYQPVRSADSEGAWYENWLGGYRISNGNYRILIYIDMDKEPQDERDLFLNGTPSTSTIYGTRIQIDGIDTWVEQARKGILKRESRYKR
jgi:hypothetical protein